MMFHRSRFLLKNMITKERTFQTAGSERRRSSSTGCGVCSGSATHVCCFPSHQSRERQRTAPPTMAPRNLIAEFLLLIATMLSSAGLEVEFPKQEGAASAPSDQIWGCCQPLGSSCLRLKGAKKGDWS
ncbi:hypothetical protein H1C71_012228 [Ictidomys tridecemlineatus]|nr:hypothetical protein H1C71_012228 [Ictidomys tridecemlineatus]